MTHPDHELNRRTWNQAVDLHLHHPEYRTKEVIAGGSSLKRLELEAFGDVRGKTLLHLMCQFGLDTLSWARQGAIVTGVDISDRSIEVANDIKKQAGLPAEFVRCDVLDLIGTIDRQFDCVYQSYGTHIWISDIFRWAKVVAHHLKPGGTFYLIDEHPANVLHMCTPPLNYFATEPERTENPLDYCETDTRIEGVHVEWQHPVSEIVNALIKAGLRIEELGEYPFGYYRAVEDWVEDADHYWWPPDGPAKFPVMLSVKASKR
jgi:SAM-dependent methyltransferase